jgi:hypothetical protein
VAYSSERMGGSVLGNAGESGRERDGPLVEEVTIGVDDVRLREFSLDERDDMREFVFSTVCAISDCVHE